MELTQENKDLCRHIGGFYFQKAQNSVNKAISDLNLVDITRATIDGYVTLDDSSSNQKIKVTIECTRPGILIGKKGENIDALKLYLSEKLGKEIQIHIVENCTRSYLTWFNNESFFDIDGSEPADDEGIFRGGL